MDFPIPEERNPGILRFVDSVTHAALGAAVGEMMLGRRLGNRALAWGALFGTLPDLDAAFSIFFGNATNLWWHRGPSHSLVVMVAAAWWLGPRLAKLWKKEKISRKQAGWFVFAAWFTHVLLDCFTVYGTSVFWPLPVPRVAFNNLFIIDPAFTLPMLVTLVWLAFLRTKKEIPKRRKLNAWGLGISAAYVILSVMMKFTASAGFDADLARRKVVFQRRMETPTPFNILLWRAVVDRGDEIWVGYRSVFESRANPARWTIYPKGAEAVAGVKDSREFKNVAWFSHGWWIARKHVNGAWIGDLRFCEARSWGAKKGMVDSHLSFAWDILPNSSGERLRQVSVSRKDSAGMLRRMVSRISGNREAWEANPRLADVTGSLPEFLPVTE